MATKAKTAPKKAKAKTPKKPQTLRIPRNCPRCGAARFSPAKFPNGKPIQPTDKDIAGEILGFKFRRVRWQRSVCSCGQILAVRTYYARPGAAAAS
jgi:hypothetical protein